MGWILLALLIGVPLIEIYLFVELGGLIGTWPTIGLVVLTAVAGSIMLRAQGRRVLARAQEKMRRGEPPVADLLDGIGLLLAGALLLTPGFLTDGVGFALLLPAARRWLAAQLWAWMQARGSVHVAGFGPGHGGDFSRDTVIDGEFETVEPDSDPSEAPDDAPRIGRR
ncbi:MAG: FxsA family protein [Rhodospirillaceae bacterium]|nr:FxsA family protein [Rhodospirillaceae bacterium]